MVQSLNHQVELETKGQSYLGVGSQVGRFLVGDKALEFYNDRNVADFVQIPWTSITKIGANVHKNKISRHFEVFTEQGNFRFSSQETGKILKLARNHLSNEQVVRLPTLLQMAGGKIKNLLAKKD